VPGVDVSGWTPAQRQAAILADNKSALNGGWDLEMLKKELDEIGKMDFDLSKTGFSNAEIDALLTGAFEDLPAMSFSGELVQDSKQAYVAPADREPQEIEGNTDPDETPEPPVEPKTKPGDVWLLGRHRLVCGDSTDADVVAKCLNGAKPHLMVTDPPYGVKYVGKTKDALTIENDAMDADGTHELWRDTLSAIWPFLIPGGVIYATVPARPLHIGFADAMLDLGALRQIMVWDKGQMVLGHSDYHYAHEPILYGWKPGAAHYFTNDRTKTSIFKFAKPTKNDLHPTMKPVELWVEFIENSSKPGDSVYEPFSGSGTTIIACERTNRTAHAIELSPTYVDVAVKRWQDFTGQEATLESTGQTFNTL
jgi:DNA modification methylase